MQSFGFCSSSSSFKDVALSPVLCLLAHVLCEPSLCVFHLVSMGQTVVGLYPYVNSMWADWEWIWVNASLGTWCYLWRSAGLWPGLSGRRDRRVAAL